VLYNVSKKMAKVYENSAFTPPAGPPFEPSPFEGGVLPRGIRVKEVLDRWYGPDCRYVKVLAEGGEVYILRRRIAEVKWQVVFYEAGDFRARQCQRHSIM